MFHPSYLLLPLFCLSPLVCLIWSSSSFLICFLLSRVVRHSPQDSPFIRAIGFLYLRYTCPPKVRNPLPKWVMFSVIYLKWIQHWCDAKEFTCWVGSMPYYVLLPAIRSSWDYSVAVGAGPQPELSLISVFLEFYSFFYPEHSLAPNSQVLITPVLYI